MTILRPIFHAFVLTHHLYVIKSIEDLDFSKVTDQEVMEMKTFRPRYLTGWNFVMQVIYFSMALIFDLLQYTSANDKLKRKLLALKGYVFTSWIFPWTPFVFGMFWSVYSINREWVLPAASDAVFPKWINHSLHTNIILFLFIETVLTKQLIPSFKSAFVGLSVVIIIYDIIFFHTYYETGRWLYGLFYILNWSERIMFMLINYFIAVAVMKIGIELQNIKHIYLKKLYNIK